MAQTFFLYDLETSGLSGMEDRIMQFAGIRVDSKFEPIGEPIDMLVKMEDDTLPSPSALMVTGITPQKTVEEGYNEREFCQILLRDIFTPDTIIVGYNNVRFDDEFIRHTLWRNFYDAYQWSYKDGRSVFDMLDVVRMTRALRPEGIHWPVTDDGKATNRLELLTKANGLDHTRAHDALSDVYALLGVMKLIRGQQPQLFDYLLAMRDKNAVKKLINLSSKSPFVYVSGRYSSEFNHATVAYPLAAAPNNNVLVYDLRIDPTPFFDMDLTALKAIVFATYEQRKGADFVPLPVKVLRYNKCPAVAPLGVLTQADGWQKIVLDSETIERHRTLLDNHPEFAQKLEQVFAATRDYKKNDNPEAQLYDGFVSDHDRLRSLAVTELTNADVASFQPDFSDQRLVKMYDWYKARNFPSSLSDDERLSYEEYRQARIEKQLKHFVPDLDYQYRREDLSDERRFILDELKLWLEALLPDMTN